MQSKFKYSLTVIAAVVALSWSACVAKAAPFQLSGPVSVGDQLQLKYQDFEVTANSKGNLLFGLVYVTSIEDVTKGTTVWAQGQNGQGQVAGYFHNYMSNGVVNGANGLQEVTFTGGDIHLFYNTSVVHTLAGSMGNNANPDANGTFTVGTSWLTANGVGGIKPSAPTVTLDSTGNFTTTPISGTGFGYLTVTGGSFGITFAHNQFGPGADLLLQSDINSSTIHGDPWPIESHDPVSGFVGIPEPSSIVLLGMGFVSLVGVARRHRRRAASA